MVDKNIPQVENFYSLGILHLSIMTEFMNNTICIIPARMGSSRFPGKALEDLWY